MQMGVTRDATPVDERRQMAVASHADACDETSSCRWKHKVHLSDMRTCLMCDVACVMWQEDSGG